MNWILFEESSRRTEDCKSHLLTQTTNGILILFSRTPSGSGMSTRASSSLSSPKYFLNKSKNT